MLDNILIERFLRQAVSTISGSISRNNDLNFKCNICGDSKKKTSSKRGHLKYHNGDSSFWYYKCFNGDCPAFDKSWPAEKWLKEFYPSLYKSYIRELIRNKNETSIDYIKEVNKKIQKFEEDNNKEKKQKSLEDEKESLKYFKPILSSNSELFLKAIHYCEQRKIPSFIWKRFFICTQGIYSERLIIPFYDEHNKIYYFQGRSLTDKEPKYLNRKSNKDICVYNIFNIDKTSPVLVFEGPIDSMMVNNGIATLGLGISTNMQNLLDSLDSYYIFDDDISGNKMCKKYLTQGKKVFIWQWFKKDLNLPMRDKWDFNEVFIYLNRINLFKFDELEKYFSCSLYDKIYI